MAFRLKPKTSETHAAPQMAASPHRPTAAPGMTRSGSQGMLLSSPTHPARSACAQADQRLGRVSVTAPPEVSSPQHAEALAKYIVAGPLLKSCGISPEAVVSGIDEWMRLGQRLAVQLGFDHDHMDAVQKLRIYHYYLPVFLWAQGQLQAHKAAGHKEALVLGISAPQGCGKTTIVEQLEQLFNWLGNTAVSVSIDDFYLSYEEQNKLAAAHPDNRLLQLRGNAGSHDLALGTQALQTLRGLTQPGATAPVPRYNKSAYSGRGDRADPATWPCATGPVQVVFFEGWMSGFAPLDDAAVAAVDPALVAVNAALRAYRAAWDELVDSWLVVRIGDPQWVNKWRLQAEEKMKASGKAGMSAEQIADFVSRFMPAYQAYLPGLYARGPTTARHGKTLIIEVDQNRAPVAVQPEPVV